MTDSGPANSIIEGTVKFRDGKKWKSRWCVMRKLSPVADCVHLQLYKDQKERQRNGQTKASLSLQQYLGFEAGFTLDKESNTLAILCEDVVPVLAFDTREILIQWRVKVQHNLGSSKEFAAVIVSAPSGSGARAGPARLHACGPRLALTIARPPEVIALWDVKLLRRFGVVENRFCVEGGSRCGRGAGLFVFAAERGRELADLLTAHSHDAQARLSLASRSGSVAEKRFSDSSSCAEECFHSSLRSVSPAWNGPNSHTTHCLSELDGLEEDKCRRPTSLPRCSFSCMAKMSQLTRSSTMGTPGSVMSPVWTMENILEKRSDSDRASIYSRSSGSASEYSVPRGGCLLDKSFESRGSPVACCAPTVPAVPAKAGGCQCQWQTCACRKKQYNGPYENYDVPKTPMPLIQEHPIDANSEAASLYDTPKKLKCLMNGQPCGCSHGDQVKADTGQTDEPVGEDGAEQADMQSNYVNVTPVTKTQPVDYGNYANIDLNATLEKFESSLQILRSAGFSQEELDALEDIPEHDDDISTATMNTAVLPADCCPEHAGYLHMGPLDSARHCADNISRASHLSDPTQHSDTDNTVSTRRSSSADFTRRHDDDLLDPRLCFTPTVLRKTGKNDRINEDLHIIMQKEISQKNKSLKISEPKSENVLVARFRDAVKIRRSSSVPSKSDKNRDSSSSNDSGVSTGSLKHHRGDFNDFENIVPNSKSYKKHFKSNKQFRNTLTPVHTPFIKSNSSDPLKHLTFQFEEVATLAKSNSFDVDTLTRRKKKTGMTSVDARHSQLTSKSTSSGASDTSDYMESLSVSSLSSCDARERHAARPRSGREYASLDRGALAD
ncbi:PREDICTED: protein Dok-7-like [Papilio xuthus]|uniref:Protein Dok-7-like n=1 Tax=Papilio xuthus TaxID=66420 RepID=A0AAJ6ZW28_PAPXU|nr:PREDICTED: protein Dok-7-like [Papilio xuthus]